MIISRDAAAERVARRLGVGFLYQRPERTGLNAALSDAQDHAAAPGSGVEALLIVPADVPLITPADVDDLAAAAAAAPGVALARSEDGGTNGLCLRPPSVVPPSFGRDSAARHERAAESAAAVFTVVRSERWALDIDWPEDLARVVGLAASLPGGAQLETLRCLRAPDFPSWGGGFGN